MDLLEALIVVSEKAANVARICRQDQHLFQLLVQKKKTEEANPRFVEDFKTLADVLIQEMVRHDIGSKFPGLCADIRGEENNVFCNKRGESIHVRVQSTIEDTSNLLRKVLNGDEKAALLLAEEVHREIKLEDVSTKTPESLQDFDVDLEDIGIWIDPIDCTGQYINGIDEELEDGFFTAGLRCVTVLIGAFSKTTQLPIIGIVNQPFLKETNSIWTGRCVWGVHTSTIKVSSIEPSTSRTQTISISSSERQDVKTKLLEQGFKLAEVSGAGYKTLIVVLGLADAYILSQDSTYKWDTCAPQAILQALGGNLLIYNEALKNQRLPVQYPAGDETNADHCNRGGLIAYRDETVLNKVLNAFN